jgi:hypothetical protein
MGAGIGIENEYFHAFSLVRSVRSPLDEAASVRPSVCAA